MRFESAGVERGFRYGIEEVGRSKSLIRVVLIYILFLTFNKKVLRRK